MNWSPNRNTSKIAELNDNSKAYDNINKDNTENIIYNVKGRINIVDLNSIDKIDKKRILSLFLNYIFMIFLQVIFISGNAVYLKNKN